MNFTINTDILARYHLQLDDFLTLLMGYFSLSPYKSYDKLLSSGIINTDYTPEKAIILSDNTKDLIAKILIESSPKLQLSPIKDFEALAQKLMDIYPSGNKPGTTYPWQGSVEEIAQKLRVLIVIHDFIFTEQEAVNATKAYVQTFKESGDFTHMRLLKYFILKTTDHEISSDFMTIIENAKHETDN